MHPPPKYAQPEIERRWLVPAVSAEALVAAQPHRLIEDRYIIGTRLRLRKVSGHTTQFKLGKKYASSAAGLEQVVSVYLSEAEHDVLAPLPSHVASKRRYAIAGGAIDQYIHPCNGLFIFEIEFPALSAAQAFTPPAFVGREITGDPQYSGFGIASKA
jgi:CYTH domain-containing protein